MVPVNEDKTSAANVSFCGDGDGGKASGGGTKVLPKTGGTTLPIAGVAGALLVGGLLIRRLAR